MAEWRELVDKKSGKKYYYNRKSKQTTWSKPAGFVSSPTRQVGGEYWTRQDPKTGKTYYINSKNSKETTWSLPAGAKVVQKPRKSSAAAESSRKSALSEKIHVSRNGDIDIIEKKAGLTEHIHVSKDGSIDIEENGMRAHISKRGSVDVNSILARAKAGYPQAAEKSASSTTMTMNHAPKIHVGRAGDIDIDQGNGNIIHVGSHGELDISSQPAASSMALTTTPSKPLGLISNDSSPGSFGQMALYSQDRYQLALPERKETQVGTYLRGDGSSPYDSILSEARNLSFESMILERRCIELDSELNQFKSGVKGTLGKVKDLLRDLERIEQRCDRRNRWN